MKVETHHRVVVGDSSLMSEEGVHLMVTSPPYPMIPMWDEPFTGTDPRIGEMLEEGDGAGAFERMHRTLDRTWSRVPDAMVDGGIVCINIGDATRKLAGEFSLYPNHCRIVSKMLDLGLRPLPMIVWRKQTNRPNKFMGSGMLPTNAYVTLEHECILLFRKGGRRRFSQEDSRRRRRSAYLWEERNAWFSDVWTDLQGAAQGVTGADRDRSAAFPLELARRLISMFSMEGDTVLDPFWGTGTTTRAAMMLARSSIGYEVDSGLVDSFDAGSVPGASRCWNESRVERHMSHVEQSDRAFSHMNDRYGFRVMTSQESKWQPMDVISIRSTRDGWVAEHRPHRT